jgi:hypothetical protein
MPKIFLFIFCFASTISACSPLKNKRSPNMTQQNIEGFVYKIIGNHMPSPNFPAQSPIGVLTTIYIYEATNIKDVSRKGNSAFYLKINKKLVTTILSDSTGYFAVALPVGNYSLFTKIGNLFYANAFDMENNIALVRVEPGKITKTVIKIDAGATY